MSSLARKFSLAISRDFFTAFAAIPRHEQRKVQDFIDKFCSNPKFHIYPRNHPYHLKLSGKIPQDIQLLYEQLQSYKNNWTNRKATIRIILSSKI
jgi:mRNA-degrading endonuclease RelE of RelBE toxin-antitoxin system